MTGLPFVFAVWAIRRDFCAMAPAVVDRLVELFHHSRERGLADREGIVRDTSFKTGLSDEILNNYFDHLVVNLGRREVDGMQRFFDEQKRLGLIPRAVIPEFASAIDLDFTGHAQAPAGIGTGHRFENALPV